MNHQDGPEWNDRPWRNRRIVIACCVFVVAMVGAAYAAVPLYDLFCRVTGFGGTPQVALMAPDQISDETVTVRFDANIAPGLPWDFEPVERTVTARLGELHTAYYQVTNDSDRPTTAHAAYNVSPPLMGAYFSKIECFCFTEQTLAPGETMLMGVTFFVDPAMMDSRDTRNVNTVTLSYTFYPSVNGNPPAGG